MMFLNFVESIWFRPVSCVQPFLIRNQSIIYLSPATLRDEFGDRSILSDLGIPWQLGKAPKALILSWHPPPAGWIKANTDGLAKGNPGLSACGGLFRDTGGRFLGGFALALGHQTAFHAEIMVVILAVEIAYERGWFHLWLESDCLPIIHLLLNDSLHPPWPLQNRWMNCKLLVSKLYFRCSHTFRETNDVADALANLGLHFDTLQWWPSPPPSIQSLLSHNANGFPCYRFS
ncbi:Ribonuclease H [Melia azedarach]|uniref:Ribonuclease H n=1 Tax=Melia azedarach TaxID=155640 RepID=A0ACC1XQP6_MELAZ|nr:Ribonuclease H [Melia azedarach]